MKAAGKTIAVTGGGNGIGRALVLDLLGRGARVAALDISGQGLAETAELAGDKADRLSTHVIDITDRDAVEALPDAIVAKHGAVDGIINCAGIIQPFVKLNALDYAAVERVMNVNFWGLLYMTKTFLPHLLERPAAHIVNVSSMGGFLPVPGQTAYGASKAAVKLLTEGLHAELRDTPVGVSIVFPGAIETEISKNSGVDMSSRAQDGEDATAEAGGADKKDATKQKGFPTTPAPEAARMIVDAMERDAYRAMIGKDARMMDRLARWMPVKAAGMIAKKMAGLLAD